MSAVANPSQPRILFLDHVGVLGGAELNLVDMARHTRSRSQVILMADGPLRPALEAVGAGVTVLAAPEEISTVRRGSGFARLVKTIPHVLSLAWKIARRAKDFDVVSANSQKSFVVGCFAAAIARRPLVWHMHDILTADHFSPANRRIVVILANIFARRVVTVSKAGLDSFVDAGGRPEIATVVYNGIDASTFAATDTATARDEIDNEFNLAMSPPIRGGGIGTSAKRGANATVPLVGVFGRLTPWKGQDVLIRALPSLPGVHALFVGEALFNEDTYAASLRTLATELGVANRTHFAGFRNDIARMMAAVDIVAHTSTSPEPFGRVIVEAMLARKPVIATAAGGAVEIISDGQDGLLVPPGNSRLLAAAIQDLLANPDRAAAIAKRGYETAVTRFTLDAFLEGVDRVAAEAVGSTQAAKEPMETKQQSARRAAVSAIAEAVAS
jgi:glycosyltransferase involved in cell wall biosynthesis